MEQAAAAGKPLVWPLADYPDISLKRELDQEGVQQVVCVPLLVKGKLVGAFDLGLLHERAIAPEALSLLSAIGQQIGVAVENARLYDRAEQAAALAERTRLARELHDSVTQSLYSVTMYAEAAAILLTNSKHQAAAQHLRELRDTAQEALREMRLLIFELRPLALEEGGLGAALQRRLDAVEARGGMKIDLLVENDAQLPPAVQQELYHIAQEALNNIVRHAHAQRVRVGLVCSACSARLEISDDGIGFDPAGPRAGGLGLAGMAERVQRIGGRLDIASAAGKGMQVIVEVPQHRPEAAGPPALA